MKSRKRLLSFVLMVICSLGVFAWLPVASAEPNNQVQFVAPKLVVNSSFLNVRSGPGIQYSVLITVVGGTELPVLARASDNVWFQVSTVVGVGWVNVQYTVPRGSFDNVPIIPVSSLSPAVILPITPVTLGLPNQTLGQGGAIAPTTSTAPVTGGRVLIDLGNGKSTIIVPGERYRALINVEAVNLRTQPFDGAPTLGTLFRDDTNDYPILGNAADKAGVGWIALDVPDLGVGWIEAPKALIRLSRVSGTVVVVAGDAIALTDAPNGSGTNRPILSNGQEAFLVGISRDSNFVQIQLGDGTTGWVPFGAVVIRSGTPTDDIDLSLIPAAVVNNPTASTTLGQGGGAAPNVTVPQAFTLDTPHIVVNTSFLNIRSGPGAQFTTVTTVSGGTQLAVLGIASDRVWFLVQGAFGRGWVNSEFVIFRGVIDVVPVIQEAGIVGTVATPTATISSTITIYAAPGTNFGAIGNLNGPIDVSVVARTADANWVQLNTSLGYGWVLASQVLLRGDLSLIPIVG